MQRKIIENQLTEIFRDVFGDKSIVINDGTTAEDIGAWDSLSHMIMIGDVEKKFNIKLKLREINKLKHVSALVDLILAHEAQLT